MAEKVEEGKVVSFSYTLKDNNGNMVEQSDPGQPLEYLHGSANIIPGLERKMEGMLLGDTKSITVPAEEGYGEYDEKLVFKVPMENFPQNTEIKEGMEFRADSEHGPLMLTVVELGDDYVIVDGNHPMAGENLHFDVKVEGIRQATQEEKEHGHVHGPEGHHHH